MFAMNLWTVTPESRFTFALTELSSELSLQLCNAPVRSLHAIQHNSLHHCFLPNTSRCSFHQGLWRLRATHLSHLNWFLISRARFWFQVCKIWDIRFQCLAVAWGFGNVDRTFGSFGLPFRSSIVFLTMCSIAIKTPIARTCMTLFLRLTRESWPFQPLSAHAIRVTRLVITNFKTKLLLHVRHDFATRIFNSSKAVGVENQMFLKLLRHQRLRTCRLDLVVHLFLRLLLVLRHRRLPALHSRWEFKKRASFRRNDSTKKVSLPFVVGSYLFCSRRHASKGFFRGFTTREVRQHRVHLLQKWTPRCVLLVPDSSWSAEIPDRWTRSRFPSSVQQPWRGHLSGTWAVLRCLATCTAAAIWTRAATCWALRVNNSCWSWITICSIVVIAPAQVEVPQVLLLRFTARKIYMQASSRNHRPEDFPVHQTRSQLGFPGPLIPRNHESEQQLSERNVTMAPLPWWNTMTLCDKYAVNLFLEPLRSVRICEWLSEDENRYYTWSRQWTEGKCACMYSVHDRVIVDNMSVFGHSSSRVGCTFSMQDSRVKRGSTTGHKTQQARLPADSGLYNSTFPSLVNSIFPECQSDHHGSCTSTARSRQSVCSLYHPRASLGSWKFCANSRFGVSQFTNFLIACCFAVLFLCSLLLLCSLLSWSVHREKCLKLVHLSLVSLSLSIRIDVRDHWQLSVSVPG